jgi:hypothetical protein
MLPAPLAAASRLLAILLATGGLVLVSAACGSTGTMTIINVDGANVAVVPWAGGPTLTVNCQTTRVVDTSAAPGQPWHITVRGLANQHLLLQRDESGDVEVLVRRDTVIIGPFAPSVGPAGVGCSGT